MSCPRAREPEDGEEQREYDAEDREKRNERHPKRPRQVGFMMAQAQNARAHDHKRDERTYIQRHDKRHQGDDDPVNIVVLRGAWRLMNFGHGEGTNWRIPWAGAW